MKIPRKSATVSKKVTDEQLQNAIRWEKFLIASGTPYGNLTDEWHHFFSAQAEIATASYMLERFIDAAIEADNKQKGLIQ